MALGPCSQGGPGDRHALPIGCWHGRAPCPRHSLLLSPWSWSLAMAGAVPGGMQAEQQPGCPQPQEAGPGQPGEGRIAGQEPHSLPGCAASPGNDSVTALGKSFASPGDDQLCFPCGAGWCPIWPEKGAEGCCLCAWCSAPSTFLPSCSSSVLGAACPCWATLSVPAPAQRGGRGRMQKSPGPTGGFMPRFPRCTISGSFSQPWGAGKVRAELAAPAAHPTGVVCVGQHSHPEPPLHFQLQLHHSYKRNSLLLRAQPCARGNT